MKYDAFISYRHLELDLSIAKQVHKKLETFKVPSSVAKKTGKKSIKRVFRDQEELPIGSDLGDNIKKALQESEYLIVICSSQTKESYWVQQEINTFIELHGRNRILAILVEGEPADSFPEQLLVGDNGEPVEPLAADVRGANKKEVNKKMQTELLRLAAPILGCTYDDLRQRHRERKLKRAIAGTTVVAGLAVAFGVYSVYNTMMIKKNYEGKQINQSKYLADTALSLMEEGDRITAGLVALEALPSEENDRPYVAQAQYALGEALNIYRNGSSYEKGNPIGKDCLLKHDYIVNAMKYSPDGTKLVSIDSGNHVYVWDAEKKALLLKVKPQFEEDGDLENIQSAAITADNQLIISTEKKVRSLDLQGKENWCIETGDYLYAFETYMDKQIGVVVSAGKLQVVDLQNGKIVDSVENTKEIGKFSGEIAYSKDGRKIAVSYSQEENRTGGAVKIWDLETNTTQDYESTGVRISKLSFTEEGNFVVLSTSDQQINNNKIYYVEKIDLESKNVVWKEQIESATQLFGDDSATIVRTRKYTDEDTGEEHNEVILTNNNLVYTWNSMDGTLVSKVQVTDNVMGLLLVKNADGGLVLENSGNVGYYNLTNGTEYRSNYLQVENKNSGTVREFMNANGVMAVRMRESPDILLMKSNVGYGMEMINSFGQSIMGMDYSTEETYYMIETMDDSGKKSYNFYQTIDNSPVGQWSYEKDSIVATGFVSDSVFMVIDGTGNVVFYDVKKQNETILNVTKELGILQCTISLNSKYAFIYDGEEYLVADLQQQKWIAEGKVEESLTRATISEDGSVAYGVAEDNSLIELNTKSGEIHSVKKEEYTLYNGIYKGKTIALSADGKMLAVFCIDGMLRIMDITKMETIKEIECTGYGQCFVQFSPDGKKLIFQGNDYYIKVYDVEKGVFLHCAQEQIKYIENIVFDEESDTIGVLTEYQMLILNEADYVPLACVDYALAYMPKSGRVFNYALDTVYSFPYMNLEMLLEEAKRQFGDRKLTEAERIKYNID